MTDREKRIELIAREAASRFGGHGPNRFFRAPGRVDIMGSHTDYNHGFILACTVDRDIMASARLRTDGAINLYSINTGVEVSVRADDLIFDPGHGWANYPKGVIKELVELEVPFTGLDLVVHGEIPIGGNLSSSAALTAVTLEAILGLTETTLASWDKIHLCHRAEKLFVGMPCGIMDQFSVFMGNENSALFLDCMTLESEAVPFSTRRCALAVIDSGSSRALVAGKYSERVEQCEEAARIIRKNKPGTESLRDVAMEDLEAARPELGEILFQRARHVVTENIRVGRAKEAIRADDPEALGRIMEEGFQSSSGDYDNSTLELDTLHDLAMDSAGVLGARICGAGWGGCILALVDKDRADALGQKLPERYKQKTKRTAKVWMVEPSAGAGPMNL